MLVNIFGGIVRCDLIADGIINAVHKVGVKVPVVVRLEGTNAEQARAALAKSGLAITAASDLTDAARKVVALAAKGKSRAFSSTAAPGSSARASPASRARFTPSRRSLMGPSW